MISRILALAISLIIASCAPQPSFASDCTRCDALDPAPWFTIGTEAYRFHAAEQLCQRDHEICRSNAPAQIHMTNELMRKIEVINLISNFAIKPADDLVHYGQEDYWTVPTDERGDCEDYVLDKRASLIRLGLPAGALQIVHVTVTSTKEGHAILGINTDRGLYLLDNRKGDIATILSDHDYNFQGIQDTYFFDTFHKVNGVRM